MARYRRTLEGSGISLESDTESVPSDGRYHILQDGNILSSHRTLKAAAAAYQALLDQLGLRSQPGPQSPRTGSPPAGDYYVYGKPKRRKTGTRTFG
jgi:hypothetical protein